MTNKNILQKVKNPFVFYARLSLTLATGKSASTARNLLEALKTCPDSVIYAHTHRFLQVHQFTGLSPANDFSLWASHALGDEELAEKLGVIEPLSYASLAQIRKDLISILSRHLESQTDNRSSHPGQELHLLSSVRFSIPTGQKAWDLEEFWKALQKSSPATIYLHACESRLRSAQGVSDFSKWLRDEAGEEDLAQKIGDLDPHAQTFSEIKENILNMTAHRLEERK